MITELTRDTWTLMNVAGQDLRRRWLSPYLPSKPTTVNLLVNDICNSRCVMCNIWQQKRDIELTPEQLASVLSDSLYSRVEYVGVSGGEPTLRGDLPELFDVICDTLPRLKGTGIITNAIRDKDVTERIQASAKACADRGIDFNVMVSLDGVGQIHDRVRGREGNFDSAVRVIRDIQEQMRLPLSVGCTITKTNLWHADELLDYCKRHGIYARFRVAEFIQRLYNFGQTSYIRAFDQDESYHLAMFFTQLHREYETRGAVRRTYQSIAAMLLGEPRRTACPYQDKAVVLDCRGDLQYCAPKSKVLGNGLTTSSEQLYLGKLAERRRVRKQDCATCIHDYHAPVTAREWFNGLTDKYTRRALSIKNALRLSNRLPVLPGQNELVRPRKILITGWYGTETVGDKAILGGIINDYRQRYPDARFTITSLYPLVTQRTLQELGEQAQVVPVYSPQFLNACRLTDEVVIGGGPLMDLGELGVVLTAFALAAANGRRRVVYGCGIGPLQDVFCIEAVKRILNLADEITLRDRASVTWAHRLTGRSDITCVGDPAGGFVLARKAALPIPEPKPVLACFLRQWPAGYRGTRSVEEYNQLRDRFEKNLGQQIRHACTTLGLRPALYSMHCFFEGCDDRRFNRRFANDYLDGLDPLVEQRPSSVDSIIQAMRGAAGCISMRFHSVLFAHTLGLNYLAIDYTLGGKISGFLKDHDADDHMLALTDVAEGDSGLLTDKLKGLGVSDANANITHEPTFGRGVAA
jgi:MoaA/NifB/PqqE/SkfB family radical SAM enzyme/polysaccharide pyruvyl transferase WcaK-like protein